MLDLNIKLRKFNSKIISLGAETRRMVGSRHLAAKINKKF
jgi:hypothetical protein